jgi:hypothetical protein
MPTPRSTALLAGALALATALSVAVTTAPATATATATAPAVRSASVQTPTVARTAVVGRPPKNYAMGPGTYFSFPNRSLASSVNIRNRVLNTVMSTWGGPRNSLRQPVAGNGTIRMATWSFTDMTMARALVAARNRGVSVQIMAASTATRESASWQWLKRQLGSARYVPGHPETTETQSFARQCLGACRGRGGTPHSKYFLFSNVGASHLRNIVVQTSMNLTTFAFQGQWNQARAMRNATVYNHFLGIFRQTRVGLPIRNAYRQYNSRNVVDLFFPRPGTGASSDPVMRMLNRTRCRGAATGSGRTRIRVIQYAIYDTRGVWLAKKLRGLWNSGCDVAMIYSVSSRPVMSILRNRSGRGAIPVRQSVTTNRSGVIQKYNHSKWMSISGYWGSSRSAHVALTGSANWSNASFSNDEQMQQITSSRDTRAYEANFTSTWRQPTSHAPGYGTSSSVARLQPAGNQIPWGQGAYANLSPNGD